METKNKHQFTVTHKRGINTLIQIIHFVNKKGKEVVHTINHTIFNPLEGDNYETVGRMKGLNKGDHRSASQKEHQINMILNH